ncbi:MAG: hypothetical protein AB8B95_02525 [Pseudohongiellaceae bacterium]
MALLVTLKRSLALIALTLSAGTATAQTIDNDTGLIEGAGWQVVAQNCTQCHSAQMITQNSGTRAVWKSRILWMQETQGLEELSENTEEAILGYLAQHYGQKEYSRRSGLAAHLMPTNPLESAN